MISFIPLSLHFAQKQIKSNVRLYGWYQTGETFEMEKPVRSNTAEGPGEKLLSLSFHARVQIPDVLLNTLCFF